MIERIRTVLTDDERIQSAWLSGSLGKGQADAQSDVDVTCVVEEEDLQACVAEYGGPRTPLGPVAHQMVVYGRVAANTDPDWTRFDLTFVTTIEFRRVDPATVKPLVRATRPPGGKTVDIVMSAERIADIAREFIRVLGLLPVAVERREWLVGLEGEALLRRMTIDLMVEKNGKTSQRGGVKRLNAFLTPDQQAALEASAAIAPTREGLVSASQAMAALFLPLARDLVEARGGTWPQGWEDATRDHLRRSLGVEISASR